jgi:hypothetical protein
MNPVDRFLCWLVRFAVGGYQLLRWFLESDPA